MKGRSLWSALMLAWLSATNVPSLPDEPVVSDSSFSEPETSGETAILADANAPDATMEIPASGAASKSAFKSSR